MMKNFAALVFAASLAACGLKPVYGGSSSDDGPIIVEQIDGRIGHHVRQDLSRTLSSGLNGVAPGATLSVVIDEKLQRLPLKLDDGVSRSALNAEAVYVLTDAEGRIINQGEEYATANFDSAQSSYGDVALQTDARERVARALARRIHNDLVLNSAKLANTGDDD